MPSQEVKSPEIFTDPKKQEKCQHPESERYTIRGGYAMGYIEWRCLKCGMEFEESDSEND